MMDYPTYEQAVEALKFEYEADMRLCDDVYIKVYGNGKQGKYGRVVKLKGG